MKKFFEISKPAIIIGAIAAILFCVDSLLAKYVWSNYDAALARGFMWVAFVAWTISFGMKNIDRVKMWIGHFVGFAAAVGMIYFGQIFGAEFLGIGIATVLGVFLFNALVMYFDNFKKYWLNSITGIFMGIFLTFSGLGVGMGADTWGDAAMTLTIILTYSLLGSLCAFASVYLIAKWKRK
jgi:hypothetical protein